MNSCDAEDVDTICWFCRKGRHNDCMKEIPTQEKADGLHDCTFDTKLVPCRCSHD